MAGAASALGIAAVSARASAEKLAPPTTTTITVRKRSPLVGSAAP